MFSGFLVDFISFPVVSGFTSAAALTIGSSQLKGLLGLPGKSNEFLQSWIGVVSHIQEAKLGDSLLAIGCVIFLVFARVRITYFVNKYVSTVESIFTVCRAIWRAKRQTWLVKKAKYIRSYDLDI